MKISNKTKDIMLIMGILLVLFWLLVGATCWVISLFAEEITKPNEINKSYAEQTIVNEMNFQKMWEYTESMTDEEYSKTFLGGKHE